MKIYGMTQKFLSNPKRDGEKKKKIDFYLGQGCVEIVNSRVL